MHLEPRILMDLTARLDLRQGRFFASCFGHRVPDELVAAVTVHGAATNRATAGFASRWREHSGMLLEIEHWDDVPPADGDWDRTLRTRLCVDTAGTVEWFSPADTTAYPPDPGDVIEFPIARGYYEVEACVRHVEGDEPADVWRVRLWSCDEYGPGLEEIDRIALQAR